MTLLKQKNDLTISAETKPLVVAGIPAYNEERTIAKLVLDAQKYVDLVLVCDDGSSDSTCEIAEQMGATVIKHETNMGYGAAIKTLFETAKDLNADVLVTIDGDGQHDPKEIPKLIKPVLDGETDIVLGSRFLEDANSNEIPYYRSFGIKLITKLTAMVSKSDFSDAQCGFRVYGGLALNSLAIFENGMGSSIEILMNARTKNLKVLEISTKCNYNNLERNSTQNPIKQGAGVITSLIKLVVEEKPLHFLGIPGLISLVVGIYFGVWMLKIFIENQQIVTNIALASLSFVLIGIFSLFTSITLYAISRFKSKINS